MGKKTILKFRTSRKFGNLQNHKQKKLILPLDGIKHTCIVIKAVFRLKIALGQINMSALAYACCFNYKCENKT